MSNMCLGDIYTFFKNTKNYYLAQKNKTYRLTKREAESLLHLSMGKTMKTTAELINCAPRTVESYVKQLKDKLGVHYKTDLADYFWNNPIKWF